MLNMKKIVILGVMAAASFAGAFFLAGKGKPVEPSATTKPGAGEAEAPTGPAEVGVPVLGAKEKELDDLTKAFRERSEDIEKRQEKVLQRERRLAILQGQIKEQAAELEGLRMQLVTPLSRLKEAKDQLDRTRVVIATEEKANLKRVATIYETMDPIKSGQSMTEMCGANQEDDAARILYMMSERSAGKVLAELGDKGLAAKLVMKIKKIREQG
jgi:flagellar motility protein MotE (MotC chaperone)